MAENLIIPESGNREEIYKSLLPQINALITHETDKVANYANISAALKQAFNFLWVGFYFVKENQLVLGPFQGQIACTRIHFNKGVCGYCYTKKETIIVADVDQFPDHIACSSDSKSEIVIPAFDKNGNVVLVLDVDSNVINYFTEVDKKYLDLLMKDIEKNVL